MIQSHHNHQDLKARTFFFFFFLPPIHYAAIFYKIYGVSGHSLEIQLYFHLPLRFRLLKQQTEKKIYTCLSFQLCNVQCQQRCDVYSTFLIQLVTQLRENGCMYSNKQSILVCFSLAFLSLQQHMQQRDRISLWSSLQTVVYKILFSKCLRQNRNSKKGQAVFLFFFFFPFLT